MPPDVQRQEADQMGGEILATLDFSDRDERRDHMVAELTALRKAADGRQQGLLDSRIALVDGDAEESSEPGSG